MGLMDPEPMGNGTETPKLKGKYTRMDGDVNGEDEESPQDLGRKRGGRSESEKYVFASAVFASLNNVLLGYDVGVMSGVILFMKEDLNISEGQQEVLVGCLSIMSLVGSLAGGRTADAVGRKWTIGLAAIVFQAGAAVMTFAPSFLVLMMGRVLAGVGIGLGVMVAPVYIAEIFPLKVRAQASALGAVGNRLSSGLVAMSFLSMSRAISVAGVFFIFAAISAQSVVFVYYCVPETKGKSLEEIEVLFQHGRDQWQQSEVELEDVVHLVEKT